MSIKVKNLLTEEQKQKLYTPKNEEERRKERNRNTAKFYCIKLDENFTENFKIRRKERNRMLTNIRYHFGNIQEAPSMNFNQLKVYHAKVMKDYESLKASFFNDLYENFEEVKRPILPQNLFYVDEKRVSSSSYNKASFHTKRVDENTLQVVSDTIFKNNSDTTFLVVDSSITKKQYKQIQKVVNDFNYKFYEDVVIITTDKSMFVKGKKVPMEIRAVQNPKFTKLEHIKQYKALNTKVTHLEKRAKVNIKEKIKNGEVFMSNKEQLDRFNQILRNN